MSDIIFQAETTTPDFAQGESLRVGDVDFRAEISKGLHPTTLRPISGLLNHCSMAEGTAEQRQALDDLLSGAGQPVKGIEEAVDGARAKAQGETVERPTGESEIRAEAKALGIKSWHVKSVDKLKDEIAKVKAE